MISPRKRGGITPPHAMITKLWRGACQGACQGVKTFFSQIRLHFPIAKNPHFWGVHRGVCGGVCEGVCEGAVEGWHQRGVGASIVG